MWGRPPAHKLIDQMGRGFAETLRAAQGPPPPPPTRWQIFKGLFVLCVLEPLARVIGWALMIVGTAGLARLGWELFG